jgi:hypothetical protein
MSETVMPIAPTCSTRGVVEDSRRGTRVLLRARASVGRKWAVVV